MAPVAWELRQNLINWSNKLRGRELACTENTFLGAWTPRVSQSLKPKEGTRFSSPMLVEWAETKDLVGQAASSAFCKAEVSIVVH